MSLPPLIIIGAGGHGMSVAETARAAGYRIAGVLDSTLPAGSPFVGALTVTGGDDLVPRFVREGCAFALGVGMTGNAAVRRRIAQAVIEAGGRFPVIVHPAACVSEWARLERGTVVMAGACVNAGASVGPFCIINTLCAVEHGACVEAHSHISTGAMVNGDCHVGEDVFMGSGAVLVHGVTVPAGCVIGAGAVVTRSPATPGVYIGVPAKPIN